VNSRASRLARDIAERYRLGPPPIDIEHLVNQLGVDQVIEAPLIEDGRMERMEGLTRIIVRADLSRERRRFTIAHELCHVLLADPRSELVATRHIVGRDEEERFCEDFAAALLLPWTWVRSVAYKRPRTLHTLRVVAGRSNTSLASACVRLNEVAGWQRSLLHWKHDGAKWSFGWAAGLPSGFEGRIRSAPLTGPLLDNLADSGDTSTELSIMIGGHQRDVLAEVSVRRRSALALAQLME
jgi:hypothetical protein